LDSFVKGILYVLTVLTHLLQLNINLVQDIRLIQIIVARTDTIIQLRTDNSARKTQHGQISADNSTQTIQRGQLILSLSRIRLIVSTDRYNYTAQHGQLNTDNATRTTNITFVQDTADCEQHGQIQLFCTTEHGQLNTDNSARKTNIMFVQDTADSE
jgi:hypothetical protein